MTSNPASVGPAPDGEWIEWSGGENPVPGCMVEWRNADGAQAEYLSDDVAGLGKPLRGNSPIVAYRVTRAPHPDREAEPTGRVVEIDIAEVALRIVAVLEAVKALTVGLPDEWLEANEPLVDRLVETLNAVSVDELKALSVSPPVVEGALRASPCVPTGALADIAAERQRQVEGEGWTLEHDDEHCYGEMAKAAACYAAGRIVSAIPQEMHPDRGAAGYRSLWPWDQKWWKPKTYRANLVRAAALIVAEIERLDRRAARHQPTTPGEQGEEGA